MGNMQKAINQKARIDFSHQPEAFLGASDKPSPIVYVRGCAVLSVSLLAKESTSGAPINNWEQLSCIYKCGEKSTQSPFQNLLSSYNFNSHLNVHFIMFTITIKKNG